MRKTYWFLLFASIFLTACQTAPKQLTPEERSAVEAFDYPVKPNDSEAVVYIVQGPSSGFLTGEKLAYKLVRKFQIGNSEVKQSVPGEYLIFKMKPGVYDIGVQAVCDRTKDFVLPPNGSVITPDMPGLITYQSTLSEMPSGAKQKFEAGKIYVYGTAPSCYLNRYAGRTYLLLGMRLIEDAEQAKYMVYKSALSAY